MFFIFICDFLKFHNANLIVHAEDTATYIRYVQRQGTTMEDSSVFCRRDIDGSRRTARMYKFPFNICSSVRLLPSSPPSDALWIATIYSREQNELVLIATPGLLAIQ